MTLAAFLQRLGEPIQSAQEETFDLFARDLPSHNLGFVDPKTPVLELTIAGRDLTVHQSPSVLASNRAGGTTGAVVWKATTAFAEWAAAPDNLLFARGVLGPAAAVLELGCGVSAVIGLLLAPRVARYVLTDQRYVARLVAQNLEENRHLLGGGGGGGGRARRGRRTTPAAAVASVSFVPLDWETDAVTPALGGGCGGFDAVVACDCVYNEALVGPFVQACADVCGLRDAPGAAGPPCVCVVCQQLRDADVFEAWLDRFADAFDVWRVPDACLAEGLRPGSGLVVHVGVLKGAAAGARRGGGARCG